MPPELHFDVAQINYSNVIADRNAIGLVNPQRFEMEQLDAIVFLAEMVRGAGGDSRRSRERSPVGARFRPRSAGGGPP